MAFALMPMAGAALGLGSAATSTAGTVLSIAGTALSTGLGVASSIAQGNQQAAAAEAQAKVAQNNADLAESQASAERRAGYEEMEIKRRETGKKVGAQRAAMGASGAAVDVGSFEDLEADTASSGEIEALNAYNAGIDAGYNYEVQATNYRNQANAYSAQASAARSGGYMGAITKGIGGLASIGSSFANWYGGSGGSGQYWDRALGQNVDTYVSPLQNHTALPGGLTKEQWMRRLNGR